MLNNWNVSFSSISFFEKALNTHAKVKYFTRTQDIYFEVTRIGGLGKLKIVLVNQYTISKADVINLKNEFPEVNCIVTAGDWNSYTSEAKEFGKDQEIGVFVISELLGALNYDNYISYVKRDKKNNSQYKNKSA